ncbi:MAG TPA: cytochrome c oxidase assembly factor Coa1 family protein [Pyrinomonadaceae bacterium]|jgi:hypothetical protein
MTTRRCLLFVGGALAGVVLFVALFVGAIAGAVLYTIGGSEAAQTAKDFLRRNEKLREDIGEVRGFGLFASGTINDERADGSATLQLKVRGARRDADASVDLIYRHGRAWHVTRASYRNEAGRTVELFDAFDVPEQTGAEEAETNEPMPAAQNRDAPNREASAEGKRW